MTTTPMRSPGRIMRSTLGQADLPSDLVLERALVGAQQPTMQRRAHWKRRWLGEEARWLVAMRPGR
jgi:hypothetical protein